MDMVKIEILGTGCKKCQQLEIAMRGVMSTPAMTINGKVVCKGQVISPEQIQPLLLS
jgi:predicted thioredoxin/glutaredoxin